jgi:hypothetical protein
MHLSQFWILSIFLLRQDVDWILSQSSGGTYSVGLCLRRQSLFGLTEWVPPENGERLQSPKRRVLNKRQDDE